MRQPKRPKPPGGEDLVQDYGALNYSRRLSDKILSAYNHAVAQGHTAIAEQLHAALAACIEAEFDRRSEGALRKAVLWQAFIDCRARYVALRDGAVAVLAAVEAALIAMRNAYIEWDDA